MSSSVRMNINSANYTNKIPNFEEGEIFNSANYTNNFEERQYMPL